MKRLYNDKVHPYLILPGTRLTVTIGGSTVILNDDILKHPDIKKLKKLKKIRIEQGPEPSAC